jgi:hypothetical protein
MTSSRSLDDELGWRLIGRAAIANNSRVRIKAATAIENAREIPKK